MSTNLKQVAQQALAALEYHQEQTRPIHQTQEAIVALRAGLHAQAEISDYDLLVVTTAYEQGFGHAFRAEINNPYKPGIAAAKAWDLGRASGRRQGEPANLAPSIYEDNARVLQGVLDEVLEMLWAPAADQPTTRPDLGHFRRPNMSKPFQINILLDVAEDDNFEQCKALFALQNIASELRDELGSYHEVTVTQVEVTDLDAQATAVEMHARDGEDLRNRIGTPAAAAVAVGQNLWVAVYEHKYGMDTFACTTRLQAEIIRENIAAEFWETEMGDLPKPEDPEELADAYFDEMGSHGEFFTIQETTLQGAP